MRTTSLHPPGRSWRWLGLLVLLLLALPMGAGAQETCTTADPPCPADEPPSVSITPGDGQHSVAELDVEISFFDDVSLVSDSLKVTLNGLDETETFTVTYSGTASAKAVGKITLRADVQNVLTARICDYSGQCSEASSTYTYAPPPPPPEKGSPVVSLDPQYRGLRLPSAFDAGLGYSTPAYVSLDVPRSLPLAYSSEQAAPTGFVQVDATPNSATLPSRMSIAVLDAAGKRVRFTNGRTENFYAAGADTMRLAAQWEMGAAATGAYAYTVVVRNWWGTEYLESRAAVTILVSSERDSPFGAGWSVAGLQRLHVQGDGSIVATQGDGTAALFTPATCDSAGCTYTSPAGDFTTLTKTTYRDANGVKISDEYRRRYRDGTFLLYTTEGLHSVTEDRYGNRISYGYDGAGRLFLVTDPTDQQINLAYDASGKLATITDPGGRVVSASVDAAGDLVRITDPDSVVALRAAYDARHRVTQTWDRTGSETGYAYDEAGKLARTTGAQVATSDGLVRPTARIRSWEAALLPAPATGSFEFPAARVTPQGARAAVIDPRGNVTRMAFDRWAQPTLVEDSRDGTQTWTRNDAGQVTQQTSSAGGRTAYNWSGSRLVGVTDFSTGAHTEFSHDEYDQVVRVWQDQVVQVHNVYGSRGQLDSVRVDTAVTRYTYDARGRVLTVVDPEKHESRVAYQPTGLENTESQTVVRGAETRTTTFGYDALGRLRSVTDPAGRVVTTAYDPINRAVRVEGPDSTVVRYGYDDPGRTYTVTDPRNQTYSTVVNALGWVERQTDPRGAVERFGYDRSGGVTVYTNRRGQRVTFTRDELGRVLTQTADGKTTRFGYDPKDRWIAAINEESTDTLHSDASGRVVREVMVRDGKRYELEIGYTAQGLRNALSATGPWGTRSMIFGHDSIFRLNYLRDLAGRETGFAYNADQLVAGVILPTKTETDTTRLRLSLAYTPLHRPERIGYNVAGVQRAMGRSYGYDVLERIQSIVRAHPESGTETRTLGYDALGQLRSFQDVREWESTETVCTDPADLSTCSAQTTQHTDTLRQESYSYDRVGNRTDRGAVVETGNRLVSFGGYTMEYDADGNMVRKFQTDAAGAITFDQTLSWNSLGQLVQVVTNGSTTSFGYDAWGRRVRKSKVGATTRYLHEGDDLLMEMDGSGNPVREYAYYPGVDQPHSVRRSSDGAVFYYATEQPGHVAGLVGVGNTVANTYSYTPFGELISGTELVEQPLLFTAREYDLETGLYYYRARYYDPDLARFVTEDPIGLAGGLNPYAYIGNDPANYADPFGLCPNCLDELVVTAPEGCTNSTWKRGADGVCRSSRGSGGSGGTYGGGTYGGGIFSGFLGGGSHSTPGRENQRPARCQAATGEFSLSLSGLAGGGLPGGFLGAGVTVGINTAGQAFVKVGGSATGGVGAYAGFGVSGAFGGQAGPYATGTSSALSGEFQANAGWGPSVGVSGTVGLTDEGKVDGFGAGVSVPRVKIGAGYGAQVSAGLGYTGTAATRPFFRPGC